MHDSRRSIQSTPRVPVEFVDDVGTQRVGTYSVEDGVVTVSIGGLVNIALVGHGLPEAIARRMLRELVRKLGWH